MSFWESNLILKVVSGSRAHGLDTPESDHDSRGVCIPPKRYLLGLSSFEQHQNETGDEVVFALAKFVRLALDGNPNILETLFVDPRHILRLHPLGERLLAHRKLFLSRRVAARFSGYALDQLKRIRRHYRWLTEPPEREPVPQDYGASPGDRGSYRFPSGAAEKQYRGDHRRWRDYQRWRRERNPARAELEERFGYDTKHAMHLCRLLKMGQEILETATVQVFRPDADWLRGIRQGSMSYPELLEWAAREETRLATLEERSPLPQEPDEERAEHLVIELQEAFLF